VSFYLYIWQRVAMEGRTIACDYVNGASFLNVASTHL